MLFMFFFSFRVLNLVKKKTEVVSTVNETSGKMNVSDENEDVSEDFDEFIDWRSKRSFK